MLRRKNDSMPPQSNATNASYARTVHTKRLQPLY
jgi:hypothetical protein